VTNIHRKLSAMCDLILLLISFTLYTSLPILRDGIIAPSSLHWTLAVLCNLQDGRLRRSNFSSFMVESLALVHGLEVLSSPIISTIETVIRFWFH